MRFMLFLISITKNAILYTLYLVKVVGFIDISDCIPKKVPADSCKLVIYFLGKKGGWDF